jgi:hypothetical protein
MIIIPFIFILIIVIRIIQLYRFIKHISKTCNIYDWRCVDENPILMLEIIDDNYYTSSEWSAYNFLFLKGPSPLSMFFSFKRLTIENIYSKTLIEKLKRHEIN